MDLINIYDNLCVYDKRSEFYKDLTYGLEKEDIPKPRENCFCDNCFHGRDRLALEILRLREAHEAILHECKIIMDSLGCWESRSGWACPQVHHIRDFASKAIGK